MENTSQDPYHDFADRYDWFHGKINEYKPELVDFYRKLFTEHDVQHVLDCACGTGRHLPLFHQLGCDIIGSDISSSMLDKAKENLSECELNIPLHQIDYRQLPLHFDTKFDAVTCLDSSILHMPNEKEALTAFKSIYNILSDGGILILTQGTSDKQWRQKPRFIPALNTRNRSRLFVIDYKGNGATYHILDFIHTDETKDFKIWSVEYPYMLLKDDYQELLQKSGFNAIDFYGSYQFDPYLKESSDILIVIAKK